MLPYEYAKLAITREAFDMPNVHVTLTWKPLGEDEDAGRAGISTDSDSTNLSTELDDVSLLTR